jgi:hypothetical protein
MGNRAEHHKSIVSFERDVQFLEGLAPLRANYLNAKRTVSGRKPRRNLIHNCSEDIRREGISFLRRIEFGAKNLLDFVAGKHSGEYLVERKFYPGSCPAAKPAQHMINGGISLDESGADRYSEFLPHPCRVSSLLSVKPRRSWLDCSLWQKHQYALF